MLNNSNKFYGETMGPGPIVQTNDVGHLPDGKFPAEALSLGNRLQLGPEHKAAFHNLYGPLLKDPPLLLGVKELLGHYLAGNETVTKIEASTQSFAENLGLAPSIPKPAAPSLFGSASNSRPAAPRPGR